MIAPTCRVGDEIETPVGTTGEWRRHKIAGMEYYDFTCHLTDGDEVRVTGWMARLDDGEGYWVELDGVITKWRHVQASVPVTEVCS